MSVVPWREVTNDPNSEVSRDLRRRAIAGAWRKPVEDRRVYLEDLARGKRVLDVGCVGHSVDFYEPENWVHGRIAAAAAECLGVDILADEIEKVRGRGYNVMLRDVTAEPLDRKFELITCGELIEHLGNPGGLFRAAGKMLEPGGRLVLTTPNPYCDSNVRDAYTGVFRESVDHVTLLGPSNIAELAEREGLRLESYRGICGRRLKGWWNRARYGYALRRYGGPGTDRFSRRMIYECVLA
jgi:2-polyprenyl-3-methyl-5-hydroxy-6-metoxy-1,4-benzoquinol methylase